MLLMLYGDYNGEKRLIGFVIKDENGVLISYSLIPKTV